MTTDPSPTGRTGQDVGRDTAPDPGPWRGGAVLPGATCVLAPNPSPMTLDGTNTWILFAPGATECAVVDPGPLDTGHLEAVAARIAQLGLRCARILLTHWHLDHTEGAQRFAELVSAPIDFPGRDHPGSAAAAAGTGSWVDLGVEGLAIEGIPTPGHTGDSYCFHVPQLGALLTGDTILGRGTTVVAWPDGALRPYLESLEALAELVAQREVRILLPGHGAPRTDAGKVIEAYTQHRHERLEQVRSALAHLDVTDGGRLEAESERERLVEPVVETVYAEVPRDVWPAARLSVRAQLDYLAGDPD